MKKWEGEHAWSRWPAGGPLCAASWRQATALALIAGLLGGVALGAAAGARRTASAYSRYLTSINASDAFVNVPGRLPGMSATQPITLISSLPGVVSHAAYLGLNGFPVVHGQVDDNFLDNSVNGSLDGEYFSQDRATVLSGQLPPQDQPAPCCLPRASPSGSGPPWGARSATSSSR